MLNWAVWAGIVFSFVVLVELIRLNILLFRTLGRETRIDDPPLRRTPQTVPLVSVIIPAKDEGPNIERSARSVLQSEYERVELVLVNDRSLDNTLDVMNKMARNDDRISVVTIEALPSGWTGKTHALFTAAQVASGDILLFTDADTVLSRAAISKTVSFLLNHELDMISLLPQFEQRGFNENAVYPHLALGFSSMYPLTDVNDPDKQAALASGCFILITRRAYDEVGSWKRFRKEITEDVALSKAVKASGLQLTVMRGGDLIRTRPFHRLADVCRFWKRIIYGGLEKSVSKIVRLTANYVVLTILFGVFLFAAALLLMGNTQGETLVLFVLSSLAMSAVVIPYGFVVKLEQGSWWYGFTAPIGMIISAGVSIAALFAVVSGRGIRWRGSVYK